MANENSKTPTQAKPQVIPLSKIHDLPNVFIAKPQDKSLGSMVLSIESSGIKEPVILRQRDDGEYQLLSGYRRRRASELAKKQDIPAHVYEMTMQEAIAYRKAVKNNPNAPITGKLLAPSAEQDKTKGAEAPTVPGDKPKEGEAPAVPGDKSKEGVAPTVPGDKPKEGVAPTVPGDKPKGGEAPAVPGDKPKEGKTPAAPGDKPKEGEAPAVPGDKPKEGEAPAVPGDKPKGGEAPAVPGDKPKEGAAPAVPGDKPKEGAAPAVPGDKPKEGAAPAAPGDKPKEGAAPPVHGDKPKEGAAPAVPGDKPKEGEAPAAPGDKPKEGEAPAVPGDKPKEGEATTVPGDKPKEGEAPVAPGNKVTPTVAELEAQVKAGGRISLTDLAAATHAEREAQRGGAAQPEAPAQNKADQPTPDKMGEALTAAKEGPAGTSITKTFDKRLDPPDEASRQSLPIQILAPCNFRATLEREKIDPLTGRTLCGPDGKPLTEKVKISPNRFKIAYVFDLSQTEGRELPRIGVSELSGDVEDYTGIYDRLTAISPLPVVQEDFQRSAKGYTSFMENRVVVKPGMSQVQTIKTLVHEIAHAKRHRPKDLLEIPTPAEKRRKEVEAESIAYVVCQHFGIDTADYSLQNMYSFEAKILCFLQST